MSDYEVKVVKGNFIKSSGNEKYNNKYSFHVYRDNSTPFFESGFLFNSIDEAFEHYLRFHIKNINEWIIKKYETNMLLWYKPLIK